MNEPERQKGQNVLLDAAAESDMSATSAQKANNTHSVKDQEGDPAPQGFFKINPRDRVCYTASCSQHSMMINQIVRSECEGQTWQLPFRLYFLCRLCSLLYRRERRNGVRRELVTNDPP